MDRLTANDMIELFDEQLKNAERIQKKIIPDSGQFQSRYYSFYSYLKPFRRVGGDFYDFKIFNDDCVSFFLADATGHGIDAAMVTGMVKLIYSYSLKIDEVNRSPGKTIERVDKDIESLLDFSFFSCFGILLDPKNKKIYWNNAGHPPAFLISQNNTVTPLSAVLPLIGMHSMLSFVDYSDQENQFAPGDKLILYTDGLTEAKNADGEEYSVERVQKRIDEYKHLQVQTLCEILINDYKDFTKGTEATDDICLVGIEFEDNE